MMYSKNEIIFQLLFSKSKGNLKISSLKILKSKGLNLQGKIYFSGILVNSKQSTRKNVNVCVEAIL